MNENMVDVLIYLYENYMDGEEQPPVEQSDLEDELTQAGFSQSEIDKALRWLDELALGVEAVRDHGPVSGSIRVYSELECEKLDLEARGMLMSLEHSGILDPVSRELVIDRLLAIDHPQVLVEEVKWVALLVLMNRPGREEAFDQLEEMLYADDPVYLH
jgi:Smg protein